MRVIAGTVRRTSLVTPKGDDTRPTTDRIKETLFNIINDDIQGADFLDIFAGSGSIGLEALSRGASSAVFIEKNKAACECILENIKRTHMDERCELIRLDAFRAIEEFGTAKKSFDVIFADPPYRKGFEKRLLEKIATERIANDNALIILEAAIDTPIEELSKIEGFTLTRIKDYKTNRHIFLRK